MQDPEALPSYPRCDIRVGAGPLTRAVERRQVAQRPVEAIGDGGENRFAAAMRAAVGGG